MRSSVVGRLIVIGAIVVLPLASYAQEATVSGTVSDSTGGVLPGVVVRALHEASGNTFEAVTDATGGFRLPVRVGVYRITAELQGFSTVAQSGVELLVGQQVVVNVPDGAVGRAGDGDRHRRGAAGRHDARRALGGNIDPRQMQELPVNGRNWMNLTMLAPGSRVNAVERSADHVAGVDRQRSSSTSTASR